VSGLGERRLDRLTSADIAAIDKDRAVVLWPVGAVEQHGPHLPCGTDAILAEALTLGAVERSGPDSDLWVLPTLSYGRSVEHLGFAGTMSLTTETLLAVCHDVAASVAASGFRRLVFVNGHGGQPQLLEVVARDIRRATGLMVFPLFPYRLGLPEGAVSSPDELEHGIHGGEIETSMVLAVAPELVRSERFAPGGDRARELFAGTTVLSLEGDVPTAWVTADLSPRTGVIGDPTRASAEQGRRVVEHLTERLAEALREIAAFSFE
jgi:creatinine amidohydrolase/Fe(II)-dependent formamide hydrolase-like protein